MANVKRGKIKFVRIVLFVYQFINGRTTVDVTKTSESRVVGGEFGRRADGDVERHSSSSDIGDVVDEQREADQQESAGETATVGAVARNVRPSETRFRCFSTALGTLVAKRT